MISDITSTITQAKESGKLLESSYQNLMQWVAIENLPAWAKESLQQLIEQEAWEELNDRFYKQNEFGTGGIRGRTIGKITPAAEQGTPDAVGCPQYAAVGSATFNDFGVIRATMGLFAYAKSYLEKNSKRFDAPKLVIAHDVRHFSRHFAELTASVWSKLGGRALLFKGPRSTPQLSFTLRHTCATAGVVITASHNPSHDNGYKAYFDNGSQIVAPHDKGIVTEVNALELNELMAYLDIDLTDVVILPESIDRDYLDALELSLIEPEVLRQNPPKMVYSPVHGTGSVAIVPALERFGARPVVVEEQMAFDGRFPTVKSPNPQNAEALSMAMAKADKEGLNVVLATDPDDDRMGAAVRKRDGEWMVLTGNTIGSLLAEDRLNTMKTKGLLPAEGSANAVLIKTFVTTPLQDAIAKAHGVSCVNTLTGFKWIGDKLALYENNLKSILRTRGIVLDYDNCSLAKKRELLLEHSRFYVFGGEESYGYLGCDNIREKDGNAATLMFAELLARQEAKGKGLEDALDELYCKYGYYIEDALNLEFQGASGAGKIKELIGSYKTNPPSSIGEFSVESIQNFAEEAIVDIDGQEVPKADLMIFKLDENTSFAVRPSGTEPRVRYYCFIREVVNSPEDLAHAKERAAERLQKLKDALKLNSQQRTK